MSTTNAAATVLAVVDHGEDRKALGARFENRRTTLGVGRKPLADRAGVDASRVRLLEAGEPTVTRAVIGKIDRALTELEREMGMDLPSNVKPVGDPADDLMEVTVEGNFGVKAVVKGPVRDSAAIQEFVRQLMADMSRENGGS